MKGLVYALFLASVALASPPVQANVYKCTINGETRYQDEPCPGDRDAAPHLEYESDPTPEPAASAAPATESTSRSSRINASDASGGAPMSRSGGDAAGDRQGRSAGEPASQRGDAADNASPQEDDGPLDRPAQLGVDIAAVEKELRAVVDERRDALGAIDIRLAEGGDRIALGAERKRVDAGFRERRMEVAQRLARLKAELAEECPNGTFQNGRRLACR